MFVKTHANKNIHTKPIKVIACVERSMGVGINEK